MSGPLVALVIYKKETILTYYILPTYIYLNKPKLAKIFNYQPDDILIECHNALTLRNTSALHSISEIL